MIYPYFPLGGKTAFLFMLKDFHFYVPNDKYLFYRKMFFKKIFHILP